MLEMIWHMSTAETPFNRPFTLVKIQVGERLAYSQQTRDSNTITIIINGN